MTDKDDLSYYRGRAEQEHRRADDCRESALASIHLKLADAYEQKASEVQAAKGDVPKG